MNLPNKFLLSDLLRHRVFCDQGIDHGAGFYAWMHPPVHRLLGWASRPSQLQMTRSIWKLNQIKGFSNNRIFVKGNCSNTDQITLDRLPTLMNAQIFNKKSQRIAIIADIVFNFKNGAIINYLISRTDPRLPGTSRWSLSIDHILDQQPGFITTDLIEIDELPLIKSSVRHELLRKSKSFRDQISDITSQASDRLEGWLEESPWQDQTGFFNEKKIDNHYETDPLEDWSDDSDTNKVVQRFDSINHKRSSRSFIRTTEGDEDPWI